MKGTFCRPKSRILRVHLSVAGVEFHAQAGGFERLLHALRVDEVFLVRDGDQADLHRREPQRKGAGVVLDEHAEEALDRAEERAVDHDRLVRRAVFADVLELEALGQVEVKLHGGELPEAAEDVDELDVDLGAVEGGFAGDSVKGDVLAVERGLERVGRGLPVRRRCRCSPAACAGSQVESSILNSEKPKVLRTAARTRCRRRSRLRSVPACRRCGRRPA